MKTLAIVLLCLLSACAEMPDHAAQECDRTADDGGRCVGAVALDSLQLLDLVRIIP